MILKKIKLTKFRKRRDYELNFTAGLNIFSGANEVGKSTVIEGACYCLFGTKALRDKLEFVVSDGLPKSKLKTVLEFEINSRNLTCARSASGAELVEGGKVICTGQKQVTSLIEDLLGMPTGTSHLLFVAKQNEIRGILESGNAHDFIERLADFSGIDTLIDSIKNKYTTGSTTPIVDILGEAEATLNLAVEPVEPGEIDLSSLADQIVETTSEIQNKKANITSTNLELSLLNKENKEIERRLNEKVVLEAKIKLLKEQRDTLEIVDIPESLGDLQDRLASAKDEVAAAKEVQVVREMFSELPMPGDNIWDGDREDLDNEVETVSVEIKKLKLELLELSNEFAIKESQIITDKKCFNCGHEVENFEELNQKTLSEIDVIKVKIQGIEQKLNKTRGYFGELKFIQELDDAMLNFESNTDESRYVTDLTITPRKISLLEDTRCKAIPDDSEVLRLTNKIAEVVATTQANRKTTERTATITTDIDANTECLCLLETSCDTLNDTSVIEEELAMITSELEELTELYHRKKAELDEKKHTNRLANERYTSEAVAYTKLVLRVSELKTRLVELDWNNNLLKSVRLARVEVIDQVWNMVLSSVSSYFSRVRGELSVVTRSDKEFKCDDRPVTSLSGSALDLLGLSFRVALTKLFIPNLGVQILDEPAAAADMNRKEQMLGFLTSLGFPQTLLISHVTEDPFSADNLITL